MTGGLENPHDLAFLAKLDKGRHPQILSMSYHEIGVRPLDKCSTNSPKIRLEALHDAFHVKGGQWIHIKKAVCRQARAHVSLLFTDLTNRVYSPIDSNCKSWTIYDARMNGFATPVDRILR